MSETSSWPSYEFRAMGSGMGVWLDVDDAAVAQEGFAEAERIFAEHEAQLSRFRPRSELSQLNARSGEWVTVSPLLWRLMQMGVALAEETDGLFDPTLLRALEAAGYTKSFDTLTEDQIDHIDVSALVGRWREIEFDLAGQAVRIPEGIKLDLGGIAKGDTAQVVVDALRSLGPVLVDAGGDLVAGDAPRGWQGWPVGVAQPWLEGRAEQDLFRLWLANGGLATSGVDYRRWVVNGQKMHHVIHPQTGRPAETDVMTVTVWHEEIAEAEVWATAVLVAGRERGFEMLIERGMTAVLIDAQQHLLLTEEMMARAIWVGG